MHKVEFYVRPNGKCPTKEFLNSIQKGDLFKVTAWLRLLSERGHSLIYPYSSNATREIKYLRVSKGTMEYRVFYFFDKDKIMTVNGYVKKDMKLDMAEVERAERLRKEYFAT